MLRYGWETARAIDRGPPLVGAADVEFEDAARGLGIPPARGPRRWPANGLGDLTVPDIPYATAIVAALLVCLGWLVYRLRKAEARVSTFGGENGLWLWEQDADLRFVWFSTGVGGGSARALGKRRQDLSDVAESPEAWAAHLADLAARRPFNDFTYKSVNGDRPTYVRASGRPFYGLNGRFRGYRGVAVDVTESFTAQREIEAARGKLVAAIDSIGTAFVLFDANDRLVLFNRKFAELYQPIAPLLVPGAGMIELLEQSVRAGVFRDVNHPAPGWVKAIMREHRRPGSIGHHAFWNGSLAQSSEHVMPDGSVAILISDVTELAAREAELQHQTRLLAATIDTIGEGLVVFDEAQGLLLWNDHFARLINAPPALLRRGTPLPDLVGFAAEQGRFGPGEPAALARRALQGWTGATGAGVETPFDGDRVFEVRRRSRADLGFVLTFVDVTERRRLDQQLRSAKEQAEIANRAKTNFLATMSHELRTPLNAIIGFSEIIEGQLLGPMAGDRYLDYIRDIHLSGSHLLDVINDILDLSKIESGKYELHERPIDLGRVITSTLRLLRDKATRGSISLVMDLPDPVPVLFADERAVKQILLNLLSNSIKFTEPGGQITLSAGGLTDGGMALSVIDTGIGIPETDIARAMAPFGQVDNSLTRRFQGTGLGLPLVKSLAEMHGGQLIIDSSVGVGTTVSIHFPSTRVMTLDPIQHQMLVAQQG